MLPECLNKWQVEHKNGRTLRNNHRIKIPPFKKIAYKKPFTYRSAIIWNQLTNDAVDQKDFSSFKQKLHKEVHCSSFADVSMEKKNYDFIYY